MTTSSTERGFVLMFNGKPVEGAGDDGRQPRVFASAEAAMAYAQSQGEPWATGCTATPATAGDGETY